MSSEKTSTYSLRLPELVKNRLERSAATRGLSVNQLIVLIIKEHYQNLGFQFERAICTSEGRKLEVGITPAENHPPGMPTCWFVLVDPTKELEIARYQIGASHQLMRQFRTTERTEYEVIADLGLALLHHHNDRGRNIARLEWTQFPTIPSMRILESTDLKKSNKLFCISQEDFHSALKDKNLWEDRHFKPELKPILTRSIALSLQQKTEQIYDQHISGLIDAEAKRQLENEKEEVVSLLSKLVPKGLNNLGFRDQHLNQHEVHIFAEHWKPGHPALENNRVICEIGSRGAGQAIADFVYTFAPFFLQSGQPYVCRWLENDAEKERQLIAP